MSVETERSSTESSASAASGLDFEDTALTLTLRLPGSSSADPDRKRSASSSASDAHQSSSLALAAAANASGAPPAPKCGAGGGVAAGEVVPQERARGRRGRVDQGGGAGQVRQGGRGRRAVPAQGEPAGLRRLRPAPPRAPGQVLLPLHHQEVRERRDEAGGRSERDGVRAHVRGQGRRLDARRRRPLEDVRGILPTPSSHEELRGCQLSTESRPMKHTTWPLRGGVAERRRKLCPAEVPHVR